MKTHLMKFFEMIIEITIEDMYVFVIIIVRMDLSSDIKEHDYIIILKVLINISNYHPHSSSLKFCLLTAEFKQCMQHNNALQLLDISLNAVCKSQT